MWGSPPSPREGAASGAGLTADAECEVARASSEGKAEPCGVRSLGDQRCSAQPGPAPALPERAPVPLGSCRLQHWALLSVSLLNCLLSTACSVGLALAVALTVHSRGSHLVRGCNSSALPLDARAAIATNDCPFNTTRIYDTALALWIASLLLAAAEAVLSGRSCLVALLFRGIGPCARRYATQQLARASTAVEKPLRDRQQLLVGLAESPA